MISNPCSWFINGSTGESFVYEGGTTLFHFCPNDNGLEKHMVANLIFFANDEKHALNVLERMFKFRIECAKKYSEYAIKNQTYNLYSNAIKMYKEWLAALENGKVKVTKAPLNQFYKVGWSSGDIP